MRSNLLRKVGFLAQRPCVSLVHIQHREVNQARDGMFGSAFGSEPGKKWSYITRLENAQWVAQE